MSDRFREEAPAGHTRDGDTVTLLHRRRRMRATGIVVFLCIVAGLLFYSQSGPGAREEKEGRKPGADPPCPEAEAPDVPPPTYERPPPLELPAGDFRAVIKTSCGDIELDLLEETAPRTVANFVFLAEEGYFDGLTWPRIERDFIIQTGDPDGIIRSDRDGPGYTIPDELPSTGRKYVYGTVAMANDGPGTGGSQFFIVVHDPLEKTEPAGIEPEYSIFGRVSEASYEVLDKIAAMPVEGGDDVPTAVQPRAPVVIESIVIETAP